MRKFLFVVLVLGFLSGCTFHGRDFPTRPVRNIQPNVTTREKIFAVFGEPVERGIDTGYETWTYYHYSLGQTLGGKRLYVIFNKDGTVQKYSFSAN